MSDARVLAELMGWECQVDTRGDSQPTHLWMKPDDGGEIRQWAHLPDYPTDLNAMCEVWKVLKERGLWVEFEVAWKSANPTFHRPWLYYFLNDLPGQVKAAIKVFKGAQR